MIALGLNFILGVMLFCGLVLGLRLERRLKALRNSHADFAKAVSELDQAALRTEDSLAKLRSGTEDARGELAARIDQARLLAQRLEKLNGEAERTLNQPLVLNQPILAPTPEPAPARHADVRQSDMRQASIRQALAEARPVPRADAVSRARSRALVDDDLFELGPAPSREKPLARPASSREAPPTRNGDDRRPSLAALAGGRR